VCESTSYIPQSGNILREVEKSGKLTTTELEKAVEAISDRVGRRFEEA
jgi:hypothetical protein